MTSGRRWPRCIASLSAMVWSPILLGGRLSAQGTTTAEIRGTVRVDADDAAATTSVRILNSVTGVVVETEARHGRFLVQGLEIGGPYVVTVRRIGFAPQQQAGLFLSLGQALDLKFALPRAATRLDTVSIVAGREAMSPRPEAGSGTTISDSLLHRLPTLNRDIYDFVRLAPHASTKIGLTTAAGVSGGGVGFRFDNYLIDGASERVLTGNSSGAGVGGKSVSLEAVQEYQVLLAPFDVRYGDFAGALVNTVSRSGTNTLHGSVFAYARNDQLARRDPGDAPYDREQYGFMLAGPLVRDRLHFIIAPELQRLTLPAAGPYVGQSATATPGVPVSVADVTRFAQLLSGYGLTAGSAGAATTGNPLANLFTRLDYAIPAWNSRVVVSEKYAHNSTSSFSRANLDTFSLSSSRQTQTFASQLVSLQLRTNLRGGSYNELIATHLLIPSAFASDVREPSVQVDVPNLQGAIDILKAGSPGPAQGVFQHMWSAGLSDNLSLPVSDRHDLTIGGRFEYFGIRNGGVNGGDGSWVFSSLDSLQRGTPERYERNVDLGSTGIPLGGGQYGAYVSDRWRVTDPFTLMIGLRADGLLITGHAPYNATVDALFGRRTDVMPAARVQLSPRLGFTWDMFGTARDQLRGGVGTFTGRPPLSWLHVAMYSYGVGIGALKCGPLSTDAGPAPAFVSDYRAAPTACANGREVAAAPNGDVDLLDRHLRMAQTLRGSLAYERRLPWDAVATFEALVTRNVSDFIFVNLNLTGPRGADSHGRILYGAINGAGVATPDLVSNYSEVIDLRNDSQNHSSEFSAQIEKRFARQFALTASYTHSRVRDVQLPLRAATARRLNWSNGRTVSGRHDDMGTGISLYDLPHRVVLAATYTAPWRRATDFSFYYVGESGAPVTYVAYGSGRRGDLNADGATGNDPLYIPMSALDTNEIRFSGLSDSTGVDNSPATQAVRVARQQSAFEKRIAGSGCLDRQRGRIMTSNSCREPWSHTTIASVRQALLVRGPHVLGAQVDVFNVLNLLRRDWGQYRVADKSLLEQVGQTAGSPATAQPIFRFDLSKPQWTTLTAESAFQVQLAVRYSF